MYMASNVSTLEMGLTNQSTVKVGVVSVKVGVARPKNSLARVPPPPPPKLKILYETLRTLHVLRLTDFSF